MAAPSQNETGIVVRCPCDLLALLLLLCKPTITIDGETFQKSWGEHFFPCESGFHRVHVSFRYLSEETGDAWANVQVAPGQVVRISYQSPGMFSFLLVPLQGSIQIDVD